MRSFLLTSFGVAVLLPRGADAFVSPTRALFSASTARTSRLATARVATMSYQDKLREAQEAREGKDSSVPPTPALPTPLPQMPARAVAGAAAAAAATAAATAASPSVGGGGGGGSVPANSKPPFSPEILEEIRTAITILAARLQREKPMSRVEFERFETAVAIIVEDALPRQELPTVPAALSPTAAYAVPSTPQVALPVQPVPPETSAADGNTFHEFDEYESDGPKWNPEEGGYGLPTGVANHYVIDNMGAMDADEYQDALRKKIAAKAQSSRQSGSYGNIVAREYLGFLGGNSKTGDKLPGGNKKNAKE